MKSIRRYFEGLGIWVAIMPFLHFPVNVRNGLYIVTGITIFVSAYLYLRKRIAVAKDRIEPTFVESARAAQQNTNEKIETVSHASAPHISGIEDIK